MSGSLSREPRDAAGAKSAVRATLLAGRAARTAEERAAAGDALATQAADLGAHAVVAGYVGVGHEPPTLGLLQRLRAAGSRVLVPVVLPAGLLEWGELPERVEDLVEAPMGLLEPPEPYLGGQALLDAGLVLVPALAVDRRGHRLGRGRGYYDRALTAVPAGVRVLAVVFDDELLDDVPVEGHDRRVDGAVTPSGTVMFGA